MAAGRWRLIVNNKSVDKLIGDKLSAADFTVQAEMGFSYAEYIKCLPDAIKPYTMQFQTDFILHISQYIKYPNQLIILTITEQPPRKLGAFCLPVIMIDMQFFGFTHIQFKKFMQRYKSYMQKGGG